MISIEAWRTVIGNFGGGSKSKLGTCTRPPDDYERDWKGCEESPQQTNMVRLFLLCLGVILIFSSVTNQTRLRFDRRLIDAEHLFNEDDVMSKKEIQLLLQI